METGLVILVFLISLVGGFFSGFVGIGGAVVITPLLLSLPQLFGYSEISMKTIAGLTMLQVFFGSLSGTYIHRKNHFIDSTLFKYFGIPLGIGSLSSSYISKYFDDKIIMLVFIIFLATSIVMIIWKKINHNIEFTTLVKDPNKTLIIILGFVTGILSGIVGAGGGIIMIPLFISLFGLDIKKAIGTSLSIVFLGSIFGSIGKILSFQVDFKLAIPVVIGSLLTAQLGAKVNKMSPEKVIFNSLILILLLSLAEVSYKFLSHYFG